MYARRGVDAPAVVTDVVSRGVDRHGRQRHRHARGGRDGAGRHPGLGHDSVARRGLQLDRQEGPGARAARPVDHPGGHRTSAARTCSAPRRTSSGCGCSSATPAPSWTARKELAARQLIAASDLDAADIARRSAEAQVKAAMAQVTQARAALSQAQVNLQKTVIKSPIDGIVISRAVERRPDGRRQPAGADALHDRRRPANTCSSTPASTSRISAASRRGRRSRSASTPIRTKPSPASSSRSG